MLATLESEAHKKVGYLQVKTVAEGSNKDYDRTNDFYRGLGFKKLEIFLQLWNPHLFSECYTVSVIADLA